MLMKYCSLLGKSTRRKVTAIDVNYVSNQFLKKNIYQINLLYLVIRCKGYSILGICCAKSSQFTAKYNLYSDSLLETYAWVFLKHFLSRIFNIGRQAQPNKNGLCIFSQT